MAYGLDLTCSGCTKAIYLTFAGSSTSMLDGGSGVQLSHGFCPSCGDLIAVVCFGPCKQGAYGYSLSEISSFEIVYPTGANQDALDEEIPDYFRAEYEEMERTRSASPKAAATMGRGILQRVLREQFGIEKRTLDAEIEAFLSIPGIPSHLTGAVDAVRQVGNFAAHPTKSTSTGLIAAVEPGEAEWVSEVILALFDFAFVQPRRLQARRDELNAKLAELGKPPLKGQA